MESFSAQTVQQMDSLLYRLETEKGVQSVVAVVERIEGGECYDFAITLGNKLGGQPAKHGSHHLAFHTRPLLPDIDRRRVEGTLPDAICRRIEKPANGALPENRRLGYRHAANSVCRL